MEEEQERALALAHVVEVNPVHFDLVVRAERGIVHLGLGCGRMRP